MLELTSIVPILKEVNENSQKIEKNLIELSEKSDDLILWLDCDREGEAIAFDVMNICLGANPKLKVQRAHFSALTSEDLNNAMQNLTTPNKNLAESVYVRQESDLRIGASFTRFQTLTCNNIRARKDIISYGPC